MQFMCNKCSFQSMDENALNAHIQTNHLDLKVNNGKAEQITVACNQCEFRCRLNIQMKNHMKAVTFRYYLFQINTM